MKKSLFIFIIFLITASVAHAQVHKNWDYKSIEEIYEKVLVKRGTLNEDGRKISFILVPAEMKRGAHEYRIMKYKNDLYEIKGTKYLVKFKGYIGHWSYNGEDGVLEIGSSSWANKFYIKPK